MEIFNEQFFLIKRNEDGFCQDLLTFSVISGANEVVEPTITLSLLYCMKFKKKIQEFETHRNFHWACIVKHTLILEIILQARISNNPC